MSRVPIRRTWDKIEVLDDRSLQRAGQRAGQLHGLPHNALIVPLFDAVVVDVEHAELESTVGRAVVRIEHKILDDVLSGRIILLHKETPITISTCACVARQGTVS